MSKIRLTEDDGGQDSPMRYIEMDPSGRYGRFKDVLGKGAMKTVYRAFDELLGIEVAWNQVKLNDAFNSSEEMKRVYSEVHLLKDLDHTSIIRFFASWTDSDRRTFNFITEMFTSGTLRGYRRKYRNVNIRTIKNWACQILKGLEYLHGHDPAVIHRDLKCDNIFVNGHLGQIKIGDLGLSKILNRSKHAHSVIGTPEFMAPELYEEEYDELVDIYSFGMCMLEMLTLEYPYSECSNPAAYYKIEDKEAKRFIGRCLGKASSRPSAHELLNDPFLRIEQAVESPLSMLQLASMSAMAEKETRKTKMSITGAMNPKDDTIFLKVQICDQNGGGGRNIYFPFDIASDTALDVATEMVKELDITDWDAVEIASVIDEEISKLLPSPKESSSEINPKQSFDYAEDENEDEDTKEDQRYQQPYYTSSSCSSSRNSLASASSPREYSLRHWIQDETRINPDSKTSPEANRQFLAKNPDFQTISLQEEIHRLQKALKGTRISNDRENWKNWNSPSSSRRRSEKKLTRTESLLDLRSKLLHQKLVEEVAKRRLFQTVGAVEDIGFQEIPGGFSGEIRRPSRE